MEFGNPGIKGLIFDYGGTIDTNGCHWGKVLWRAYERCHIPVTEEEFRKAYVYGEQFLEKTPIVKSDYTFYRTLSVKLRLEMEHLCVTGAWNADESELKLKHEELLEGLYQSTSAIVASARNVLVELKKSFPMVIVTNFYGNMNAVLKEFKLDSLFDAVVESATEGIRKPDFRLFKIGVKALNMPPEEVLVIGDSFYKDVQPAQRIGCKTVWFKGEGWTDKQYDETVPDYIITDFKQLSGLFH